MNNRLSGPIAWLLVPVTAAMMIFILAPLLVTVAISISDTPYVVFPPRGFTLNWYAKVLQDADFQASLAFSILLAVGATAGRTGCSASRRPSPSPAIEFPGRGAVAAALLSPLVFPVLITGVALLQLFAIDALRQHAAQHADRACAGDDALRGPHRRRQSDARGHHARRCGADPGRRTLAGVPPHHHPADRARAGGRRAVRVHGVVRQFPDLAVARRCAAQSRYRC